ncbi:MAG TPA: hypothetical protein VG167_01015 [Verrucomicrobiae bacterium]|nr:hypothetical protein [Verrucomicrobiae bacterium]
MNPNSKRHRRALLHQRRRLRRRFGLIADLYIAELKHQFRDYPQPVEDTRYVSAVRNFRRFFPWIPLLYQRLHYWDAHRHLWGGTLTGCAWHVAGEVYSQRGLVLMGFNENRQQCFLRAGLIALCKVLINYRLP